MKLTAEFIVKSILLFSLVIPGAAFSQESDLQTLVDELQALSEKARKERAADRWLQNAMDDLVAKYNYPWKESLFSDDFADGDYQNNPVWQVSSGEFWVDRRLGLRSQVSAKPIQSAPAASQQKQSSNDIGKALLGAFLQDALGPQKSGGSSASSQQAATETVPASIRTAVNIPTTFAVESVFSQNNRPGESGQFEWVVMQDEQASNAYRVVVSTGSKGVLDVIRTRGGRDSYVNSVDAPGLNDGGEHILSWRQAGNGDIEIYLDGQSVLKSSDNAFRYGFKYLGLINRSGDFSVSGVEVLGGR